MSSQPISSESSYHAQATPLPLDVNIDKALLSRQKNFWPITDLSEVSQTTAPDLFSNDYLSLSIQPELRKAFLDKVNSLPVVLGSGGSRLTTGNTSSHVQFETKMKEFFGAPAVLLCNSGFEANVAFFQAIPQASDVVVFDEYFHASGRDGMEGSRARDACYPFAHNSIASLRWVIQDALKKHPQILKGQGTMFVAVEALYSMDGDFAPLPEIVKVVKELIPNGCGHVYVDEAHTTGIYGSQGRGLVSALGLDNEVGTVLHTCGKARAAFGGILCTSPRIKKYIINYARPHVYTTSLPHMNVLALEATSDYIASPAGAKLISNLFHISVYFAREMDLALKKHNIPPDILRLSDKKMPRDFPAGFASPMHPLSTPAATTLMHHLRSLGYSALAIKYPVVPKGMDRLRVCMHGGNTEKEMDQFIGVVVEWAKKAAVNPPVELLASTGATAKL